MSLYLATIPKGAAIAYELRQSFSNDGQHYTHRTVFDLGPAPKRFITPFDDKTVLFDETLLAAVDQTGEGGGELLLERLLLPFLPREVRRRLALFPPRSSGAYGPLSEGEREAIRHQVHLFDRRRLYYLRYGAVDQSRLSRLHEKCSRPLLGQSRDEREYYFTAEEQALEPGMYLHYLYAIFAVARHFPESFAPWFPEALEADQVADHFVHELCRLNGDPSFFPEHREPTLHPHLRRYLVMFFDHRPNPRSFERDFAAAFIAGRRRFRWPQREKIPPEQLSAIFATPAQELHAMSLPQLTRLYRQLAKRLHPDQGGNHQAFINLTEAYKHLRRLKRKEPERARAAKRG